jgi:hypothetical protein
MYTTKNTKCSNFTCEIGTRCKRAKLSVYDSITPYYCFPYIKKKKYCKSFIEIDKIETHNDLSNSLSKEFGI